MVHLGVWKYLQNHSILVILGQILSKLGLEVEFTLSVNESVGVEEVDFGQNHVAQGSWRGGDFDSKSLYLSTRLRIP